VSPRHTVAWARGQGSLRRGDPRSHPVRRCETPAAPGPQRARRTPRAVVVLVCASRRCRVGQGWRPEMSAPVARGARSRVGEVRGCHLALLGGPTAVRGHWLLLTQPLRGGTEAAGVAFAPSPTRHRCRHEPGLQGASSKTGLGPRVSAPQASGRRARPERAPPCVLLLPCVSGRSMVLVRPGWVRRPRSVASACQARRRWWAVAPARRLSPLVCAGCPLQPESVLQVGRHLATALAVRGPGARGQHRPVLRRPRGRRPQLLQPLRPPALQRYRSAPSVRSCPRQRRPWPWASLQDGRGPQCSCGSGSVTVFIASS
jgi:hypothetical protein